MGENRTIIVNLTLNMANDNINVRFRRVETLDGITGVQGTIYFVTSTNLIYVFNGESFEPYGESVHNKITSLSSSSTHQEYPSAKAVYDVIVENEEITATALTDLDSRVVYLDENKLNAPGTAGTSGQVLKTDGNGSTLWETLNIPDVSQFITNTVNNLVNYYTKSETYTKTEVNDLIDVISQFDIAVADELPEASSEVSRTMYLVPAEYKPEVRDEWIALNKDGVWTWERIGGTEIDIEGYATLEYVDEIEEVVSSALNNLNSRIGSLEGREETDPVFMESAAYNITPEDISVWNAKQDAIDNLETIISGAQAGSTAVQPEAISDMATQAWVSSQGYLTGYTETDPVFTSHPASGIKESDITSWKQAYHKDSNGIPKTDLNSSVQASLDLADSALQSFTETDPVFMDSPAAVIETSDINYWNDKYTVPAGGIPKSTLNSAVQASLDLADTALQVAVTNISTGTGLTGGPITTTGTIGLATTIAGSTTVSSVSSIPVTHRAVLATVSENATLSFAALPADGYEVHVIIRNSGSSIISITLPSSGSYVCTSIPTIYIGPEKYGEVNILNIGGTGFVHGMDSI